MNKVYYALEKLLKGQNDRISPWGLQVRGSSVTGQHLQQLAYFGDVTWPGNDLVDRFKKVYCPVVGAKLVANTRVQEAIGEQRNLFKG